MVSKTEKFDISVLIVDDEPAVLQQLIQLVRRRVRQVYSASNGEEALKIFHDENIELIISDVDMPIMDGIELLKSIREKDENISFILSTGLKSLDVLATAIEYGITSFLPKPLQKENLFKKIKSIALEKQLEIELQKSIKLLEQYKNVVDVSSIVSKTDTEGIITYVNEEFCKISGYTKEELIGNNHNILRHPSMSSETFEEMWNTIKSKKVWHGIMNNKAKDGHMYIVKSVINPIFDEDGTIVEYLAIREDITETVKKDNELKRKSKKLKRKREKLYNILNNMESIVAMSSEDQKLTFANNRFFNTFAYTDLEDFMTEHNCICDMFEKEEGYLQKRMDGELWVEYIINHPDNTHKGLIIDKNRSRRIYAIKVTKIMEESEYFHLITLNDITEIDNLRNEAEKSAKAKVEFLANMSHEIRTPMNGILGFTKLLQQTGLSEKQKQYLKIIDGSTNTLLGIVDDILDFSKIQSGKFELDITQLNPFIEYEKMAMIFMAKAQEKKIVFSVEIDSNISECIKLDLLRMQQIVSNLISNAIKFTPNNGNILLYVKLLGHVDDEITLTIGVRDSGVGISQENQKHIFKAFSQADSSTTRQFGGTGLGLTISAYFVSLMGGSLQVNSEEGVGSDFFFDIIVKTCKSTYSLAELFTKLNLNIIQEPEPLSPCQKNMMRYLDGMKINYRILKIVDLPKVFKQDEVYILFSDREKILLDRLVDENIKTILAYCSVTYRITEKNIVIAGDLKYNLSVLYNILLEIGLELNQDSSLLTLLDNNKEKTYEGAILIAEDNEVNQMFIREMLLGYGLKPVIVADGKKAVREALKNNYDLILMDINMPMMGGIEALHIIKENKIFSPVVALTANAMEGDKQRFIKEGFDDYMSKPIVADELERILSIYLKYEETAGVKKDVEQQNVVIADNYINMDLIRSALPFPDILIFKFFKSFIDTYPEQMQILELAIQNMNYKDIEQASHGLRGAAANLRIQAIEELTKKIEEASRENIDIEYQLIYNRLVEVITIAELELQRIIDG